MAVGKNKCISKGKKGSKKKVGDAFSKKEWYYLKPPSFLPQTVFGKTLVNKSHGTKQASDSLKGRVYEVNLADLINDEDQSYRKIKLYCEDVQGRYCLTEFHGMNTTRHSLCSMIRKWHTLIECHVDVVTLDRYVIRVFAIALTQRRKNQVKSTCYLLTSKAKIIREQIKKILHAKFSKCKLKDSVLTLPMQTYEKSIVNETRQHYPLQNICIRKIKILKKPKADIRKSMRDDIADEAVQMVPEENNSVANKFLQNDIKS